MKEVNFLLEIENVKLMSKDAIKAYERFKRQAKFIELKKKIKVVEFAVYLYAKIEAGTDNTSTYNNVYQFFTRISALIDHKQ